MPTFCPPLLSSHPLTCLRFPQAHLRDSAEFGPFRGTVTNHDFFSGSGSSYVIGKAEATEDEDWDF